MLLWIALAAAQAGELPHHCLLPPSYREAGRPAEVGAVRSERFPLVVHYRRQADAEKADLTLAAAELAWQVQVLELGFHPPALPDTEEAPELDLYLTDLDDWEAWAWAPDLYDLVEGDGFMGAPAYVAIDDNLPDDWIDVYVAHEFNHVLQWATDYSEPTLTVWEATAVSAQTWTLGEHGQWDLDVGSFQDAPWMPALVGDGYWMWDQLGEWSAFEYGSAVWMMHLDQVYGASDGAVGPAVWQGLAAEVFAGGPDVLDGVEAAAGRPWQEVLNDLARTRWLVGEQWDDRGLAEAAGWGEAEKVPALELDEVPDRITFEAGPMVTGQVFATSPVIGGSSLQVRSASGLRSGLWVQWEGGGARGELAAWGEDPQLVLPVGAAWVTLAVTNLGAEGWRSYDAAYLAGDQELWLTAPAEHQGEEGPGGCANAPLPSGLWGLVLALGWRRRG
ncbi:MAG: hypothetical protein JXX28_10905 [Deltaproteobacteria bacterium]|nr:hypothetical protein [Deltaproteobacteria bacterium]